MGDAMSNESLQIANIEFAVTSQIGRAPHWTMVRELTMNAIEAASKATGEKLVHWTTGTYNEVRKAVIWNTGPGMDAAELKQATDLACEVGKKLGLDDNFGVGAKVSSLPNNKLGMRMRDRPGRETPRFPEDKAEAAGERIVQELNACGLGPGDLGISQAAAGGDLLFCRACLAQGMRLKVYL